MRLFIAIDPDAPARAALADRIQSARKELGAASSSYRWVAAESAHRTLHFLGDVRPERAPALVESLRAPCELRSFDLSLDRFGVFPHAGPPRTLWLGVGPGGDEVQRLHEELGRRLSGTGFPTERRPFFPHLTVARVRDQQASRAGHLRETLSAVAMTPIAWRVTRAVLYESDLSGPRPRYASLANLTLAT